MLVLPRPSLVVRPLPNWGKRDACFDAHTVLTTDRGPVPIHRLSENDRLLCFSGDATLMLDIETVECHRSSTGFALTPILAGSERIWVTHNHTLRLANGDFRWASELQPNDRLAASNGPLAARIATTKETRHAVYNVRLRSADADACYCVGAAAIAASDRL